MVVIEDPWEVEQFEYARVSLQDILKDGRETYVMGRDFDTRFVIAGNKALAAKNR